MEDPAPYTPEKPDKLKIEVEGFYRSAMDEKVFIYMECDDLEEDFPFLAVVIGKYAVRSYTREGKFYLDDENDFDLISPWEE